MDRVVKARIKIKTGTDKADESEQVIPLGRGYVLKALDESLQKHETGQEYKLSLKASEAYGARLRDLIKMIPSKYFRENDINPYSGLVVNIDGVMGKIISASPGRVMVDFNHPLAGKDLNYEVKILREIIDPAEKTEAVLKALTGQEIKASVEGETILIKDTIGLPETIKNNIENEIKEVTKFKNIKFIS